MDKVIVIGCDVGGYGVVRALAGKSLECIGLSYDRFDTGFSSRYFAKRERCPHPRKDEYRFIRFLQKRASRWGGALILETNDHAAVTLSRHREQLSRMYRLITPPWEVLRLFIEKNRTWRLAQECGVHHPETWIPENLPDLQRFKGKIPFPSLVKPIRSHEFVSRFRRKNFLVHDWEQCESVFRRCLKHDQRIMLQEIVPGSDENILKCMVYTDSEGHMGPLFYYRKIRQNPPGFGVMRVGESIPALNSIRVPVERLLKHAGYQGICTVEFKKDPREDLLKLIEVNARMPRMNWLATYAGINFPWIAFLDTVRNVRMPSQPYRKHAIWIEMYADIFNTLFRHRQEKFNAQEYISPYRKKDKTFALCNSKDPAPIFRKTWTFLIKGGLRFRRAISTLFKYRTFTKSRPVAYEAV